MEKRNEKQSIFKGVTMRKMEREKQGEETPYRDQEKASHAHRSKQLRVVASGCGVIVPDGACMENKQC